MSVVMFQIVLIPLVRTVLKSRIAVKVYQRLQCSLPDSALSSPGFGGEAPGSNLGHAGLTEGGQGGRGVIAWVEKSKTPKTVND
jgi:hypothetical protein